MMRPGAGPPGSESAQAAAAAANTLPSTQRVMGVAVCAITLLLTASLAVWSESTTPTGGGKRLSLMGVRRPFAGAAVHEDERPRAVELLVDPWTRELETMECYAGKWRDYWRVETFCDGGSEGGSRIFCLTEPAAEEDRVPGRPQVEAASDGESYVYACWAEQVRVDFGVVAWEGITYTGSTRDNAFAFPPGFISARCPAGPQGMSSSIFGYSGLGRVFLEGVDYNLPSQVCAAPAEDEGGRRGAGAGRGWLQLAERTAVNNW